MQAECVVQRPLCVIIRMISNRPAGVKVVWMLLPYDASLELLESSNHVNKSWDGDLPLCSETSILTIERSTLALIDLLSLDLDQHICGVAGETSLMRRGPG